LDTDASDFGLGAALSQRHNEAPAEAPSLKPNRKPRVSQSEERVIAYATKTLSKAERKYETTRKDMLAVIFGLEQYRQYLLGRHFVIRTDHAALSWLRRTPEPMLQLARWLTFVKQFDYDVVHRDGARHGNADGRITHPKQTNRPKTPKMKQTKRPKQTHVL